MGFTNCKSIVNVLLLLVASWSAVLGNAKVVSENANLTGLFEAIKRNDAVAVEATISKQQHLVNARNESLWAPLHVAAFYGSINVARYLLEIGAQVDATNNRNEQPLHLAALTSHLDIVTLILELDSSKTLVNAKQSDGQTPIFYAAKSNGDTLSVSAFLVEKGADITVEDSTGMLPIHVALISRNFGVLKYLIQKQGSPTCCNRIRSKTLSHLAAEYNLPEFVAYEAFNVTALDAANQTPLCQAAANGTVDFTSRVIAAKLSGASAATGNCVYSDGKSVGSPLHVAVFNGHLQYVQLLLKNYGPEIVTSQDSTGATPLHALAAGNSQIDSTKTKMIAEALVGKNSFIVEAVDFSGKTPFLACAAASNEALAELLLQKWSVNPSAIDNNGYTAFHLASDDSFVDFLLKVQHMASDVNSLATGGVSPLHVAVKESKSLVLVRHLVNHRAKLDAATDTGKNVLHLAIEANNLEALSYFVGQSIALTQSMDKAGESPFLLAIRLGKVDAATILATALLKADKKWLNSPVTTKTDLETPLHAAARYNVLKIVEMLLSNGANISSMNSNDETALHGAVVRQNVEVVRLFSMNKNGLKAIMARDKFDRTPVHLAARSNRFDLEMASIMLASISRENVSAILKMEDKLNETPLHRAVTHESGDMVRLLLEKFNDSGCRRANKNGQSPFDYAVKFGYHYISSTMVNTKKCEPLKSDCEVSSTVRLSGGSNKNYGFVEVFSNNQWGLVCDDSFTRVTAQVICRSLCLQHSNARFFGESTRAQSALVFGTPMATEILLNKITCDGTEKRFEDCPGKVWGPNSCNFNEMAAVSCQ